MVQSFACRASKAVSICRRIIRLLSLANPLYAMLAMPRYLNSSIREIAFFQCSLQCLNKRDIVSFQQYLTYGDISMLQKGRGDQNYTQISSLFIWVCLCSLLHFNSIVDNEVHKFIKTLMQHQISVLTWLRDLANIPLFSLLYVWPVARRARWKRLSAVVEA